MVGALMTTIRETSEGQNAFRETSTNQTMRRQEHCDRARNEIAVSFETKAAMAAKPNMLAALAQVTSAKNSTIGALAFVAWVSVLASIAMVALMAFTPLTALSAILALIPQCLAAQFVGQILYSPRYFIKLNRFFRIVNRRFEDARLRRWKSE